MVSTPRRPARSNTPANLTDIRRPSKRKRVRGSIERQLIRTDIPKIPAPDPGPGPPRHGGSRSGAKRGQGTGGPRGGQGTVYTNATCKLPYRKNAFPVPRAEL